MSPFLCKACQFYPKKRTVKVEQTRITSYYDYSDTFRSAYLQYKEVQDRFLAPCFVYPILMDLRVLYGSYTFVLAPSRIDSQKKRGFQHLELLLEVYGFKTCSPFENHAREDQTQIKDRRDIHQAIHFKPDAVIPKRKVILFDDILSSGATILRCHELLIRKCDRVKVVVLASTGK